MILFKFLLLALLVFVLFPVIRLGAALFRAYRHVKGQAAAFGGYGNGADTTSDSGTYTSKGRRRRKAVRKVFHPDEGEYVRFEEVEVNISEEQERRRRYESTSFRMEEQVSDAEWTEIKG